MNTFILAKNEREARQALVLRPHLPRLGNHRVALITKPIHVEGLHITQHDQIIFIGKGPGANVFEAFVRAGKRNSVDVTEMFKAQLW